MIDGADVHTALARTFAEVADHVVAQEHFNPNADLILESRSGIQNPVNLVLCSTYQNSAKGANPLGIFSTTDGQRISGVYTPSRVSPEPAPPRDVSQCLRRRLRRRLSVRILALRTIGVASLRRTRCATR